MAYRSILHSQDILNSKSIIIKRYITWKTENGADEPHSTAKMYTSAYWIIWLAIFANETMKLKDIDSLLTTVLVLVWNK